MLKNGAEINYYITKTPGPKIYHLRLTVNRGAIKKTMLMIEVI